MSDKELPSGKQYVYAFSSRKLVLLVSMVLILMALSMMLGIRLERFQRTMGLDATEVAQKEVPLAPAPSAETEAQTVPAEALENADVAPADVPQAAEKSVDAPPQAQPAPAPAAQVAQPAKQKSAQEAVAQKPVAAPLPVSHKEIVQPVPPPSSQKAAQAPPAGKGYFAIQISSSQDKALATHQMEELKAKGFHAYVQEIAIEGKGKFYRLLIGPFKTEAEATVTLNKLKKDSSYAGSYVRYLP
jgi:cell division septation protein DedD